MKAKNINEWRRIVTRNGAGKCALCGGTDRLEAHHIKARLTHPVLTLETDNGQLLCKVCHGKAHGVANTEFQEKLTTDRLARYEACRQNLIAQLPTLIEERERIQVRVKKRPRDVTAAIHLGNVIRKIEMATEPNPYEVLKADAQEYFELRHRGKLWHERKI
jgi:predicted restriction endonuclease